VQRALLWAAGVLGALSIIIAILIVIKSHNNIPQQQRLHTPVTDTGARPANSESSPRASQQLDYLGRR